MRISSPSAFGKMDIPVCEIFDINFRDFAVFLFLSLQRSGPKYEVWALFLRWFLCFLLHVLLVALGHVWLFPIPWAEDHQAPLSMEFSRQAHWSRLIFPIPGDLPDPGSQTHVSCLSCILAGRFFSPEPPGMSPWTAEMWPASSLEDTSKKMLPASHMEVASSCSFWWIFFICIVFYVFVLFLSHSVTHTHTYTYILKTSLHNSLTMWLPQGL